MSEHIDPLPVEEDGQNEGTSSSLSMMTLFYTLGLGSIIASAFYYIVGIVQDYIKQRMTSSINIENSDPIYNFVKEFLMDSGLLAKSMTNVSATLEFTGNKSYFWEVTDRKDSSKNKVSYNPGPGDHSFLYKGVKIFASLSEGKTNIVGYEKQPMKEQSIYIWCFGSGKVNVLKSFIEESYKNATSKDSEETHIYAKKRWDDKWEKKSARFPRKFESVILDQNMADEISVDIERFLKNEAWYQERGVPYRRGYLLYGPPGTGKTSFILAIAGKLNLNICPLNLTDSSIDDDTLCTLLSNLPKRACVLLEDVDAIFVDRDSVNKDNKCSVSFSGLLNALDGVRSTDGRILFMTTNHKEKLDEALLRPGRADIHIKLNNASENQAYKLFLKFFPGKDELAQQFSEALPEFKVSMAKLQGHFLKNQLTPEKCIQTIDSLFELEHFEKEMSVVDWLLRLNLEKYAHKFFEKGVKRIDDFQSVGFDSIGIENMGDTNRMEAVKSGNEAFKKKFQFMTQNSLRGFLNTMLNDEKFIKKLLELIPVNLVTEYQLRDIVDNRKFTKQKDMFNQIRKLVQRNQLLEKNPSLKSFYEKPPKETKVEFKFDVLKIFEELELKKYTDKLIENGLNDPVQFLDEEADKIIELLDVKEFLKKKVLKRKIEELKKEKEKLVEKQKLLDQDYLNVFEKQFLKSKQDSIQEEENNEEEDDGELQDFDPTKLSLVKNHSDVHTLKNIW